MKALLLNLCLIYVGSLYANMHLAPPSFEYRQSKAVFIDISEAHYDIRYYTRKKTSFVDTLFEVEVLERGYPLIDFVPSGMKAWIDGEKVGVVTVPSPDKVTDYKLLSKELSPGKYSFKLSTKVKNGTKYRRNSVNSGFFIKDLTEKKFLEKYLPSNLEYDQYKAKISVKVYGSKSHTLMANGDIKKIAKNHYEVQYPSYYSSSSFYFHLFKTGTYKTLKSTYQSIDGRTIPITIYAQRAYSPTAFMKEAKKVFAELEADYGVWPHSSLLVYAMAKSGGMEYPAATATSFKSLDHEMLHSYFAKSVIPADGNSGWMDEGIASWRDYGYLTLSKPEYESINLGAQSVYKRNTDKRSYKVGRSFFAYLNSKFDLKKALKAYHDDKKHSLVTTWDMIRHFEKQTDLSLEADFLFYVLGQGISSKDNYVETFIEEENPHHPNYTEEDFLNML